VNTTGFKPVHSKPAIVLVKGRSYVYVKCYWNRFCYCSVFNPLKLSGNHMYHQL
jgi:hypothetical protein